MKERNFKNIIKKFGHLRKIILPRNLFSISSQFVEVFSIYNLEMK